jgi:hypothetical protein
MIIMYSKRRNNGFDLARTSVLAGISVLAPDSPTLYVRLGIQRTIFFLGLAWGLGTGSAWPNPSPASADRDLSIRFCQTPPSVPSWLWIDFAARPASRNMKKSSAQEASALTSPGSVVSNSQRVACAGLTEIADSIPEELSTWPLKKNLRIPLRFITNCLY